MRYSWDASSNLEVSYDLDAPPGGEMSDSHAAVMFWAARTEPRKDTGRGNIRRY
jgi:hypothetical protein